MDPTTQCKCQPAVKIVEQVKDHSRHSKKISPAPGEKLVTLPVQENGTAQKAKPGEENHRQNGGSPKGPVREQQNERHRNEKAHKQRAKPMGKSKIEILGQVPGFQNKERPRYRPAKDIRTQKRQQIPPLQVLASKPFIQENVVPRLPQPVSQFNILDGGTSVPFLVEPPGGHEHAPADGAQACPESRSVGGGNLTAVMVGQVFIFRNKVIEWA